MWDAVIKAAIDDPLTASTVLLAAFTFMLACFSLWQTLIVRSSARRQLRAYVGFAGGNIRLDQMPDGKFRISAHIDVRNSGQTPAYDVRFWIEKPIIEDKEAKPFPATSASPESAVAKSILFSDQKDTLHSGQIEVSDIGLLREGAHKVFVRGGVEYKDAFRRARYLRFHLKNSDPHSEMVGSVQWVGWLVTPHPPGHEAN